MWSCSALSQVLSRSFGSLWGCDFTSQIRPLIVQWEYDYSGKSKRDPWLPPSCKYWKKKCSAAFNVACCYTSAIAVILYSTLLWLRPIYLILQANCNHTFLLQKTIAKKSRWIKVNCENIQYFGRYLNLVSDKYVKWATFCFLLYCPLLRKMWFFFSICDHKAVLFLLLFLS